MKRGSIIVLCLIGGVLFFVANLVASQDKPQDKIDVKRIDQKKIDEAIDKGVEFLLGNVKKWRRNREIELVTLTLLHAGVKPEKNEILAEAIQELLICKLEATYNVALLAMALELAGPQKYQYRIAECAIALVNYQCKNGQWDYPSKYKSEHGRPIITGENVTPKEKEIITDPGVKPSMTKLLKKIKLPKRTPLGGEWGDNSNTQFALMGLRAAARCGIEIPKETWELAVKWLEQDQLESGGWGYSRGPNCPMRRAYGSMTVASLCGLAIAKFYLGQDIKNDPAINKGLNWLARNLRFDSNPGSHWWLYYYIYGVERVGACLDTEFIVNRQWYPEGVEYLLKEQKPDGSWNCSEDDTHSTEIADTCFAILFLRRATPKLIPKPIITEPK